MDSRIGGRGSNMSMQWKFDPQNFERQTRKLGLSPIPLCHYECMVAMASSDEIEFISRVNILRLYMHNTR